MIVIGMRDDDVFDVCGVVPNSLQIFNNFIQAAWKPGIDQYEAIWFNNQVNIGDRAWD